MTCGSVDQIEAATWHPAFTLLPISAKMLPQRRGAAGFCVGKADPGSKGTTTRNLLRGKWTVKAIAKEQIGAAMTEFCVTDSYLFYTFLSSTPHPSFFPPLLSRSPKSAARFMP